MDNQTLDTEFKKKAYDEHMKNLDSKKKLLIFENNSKNNSKKTYINDEEDDDDEEEKDLFEENLKIKKAQKTFQEKLMKDLEMAAKTPIKSFPGRYVDVYLCI
jgi:LPS O-antigen subunit length determinant protein (WzzB/FepE family)